MNTSQSRRGALPTMPLLLTVLLCLPLAVSAEEQLDPELLEDEELLEEEAPETEIKLGPDGTVRGGTGSGGECPAPCAIPES